MFSRSARPHLSFLKHQPAGAPGARLASCLPPHNADSPGMKDQVYSNSGLRLGGQDKDCRGSCDTLKCSRVNSPKYVKNRNPTGLLVHNMFPHSTGCNTEDTFFFAPPLSLVPRKKAAPDTTQHGFWGKDRDVRAQTLLSAHTATDRGSGASVQPETPRRLRTAQRCRF